MSPLPGAHAAEARLVRQAAARREAAAGRRRGPGAGGRGQRQPVHHRQLAGPDAHGLRRPPALHRHLFHRPIPASTSPATAARRDEDGYYWITGRVDDVINVSGHRLGTAEIESALVGHHDVAEAAVVGYPHDIKGQGIYCYVTLKVGVEPTDGAAGRPARLGAPRDRAVRRARRDPVRAGPAQDPLGQDHAPHPAQDRRGRPRQPRRHLDPGRPGGGRRPGEEPRRPRRRRGPSWRRPAASPAPSWRRCWRATTRWPRRRWSASPQPGTGEALWAFVDARPDDHGLRRAGRRPQGLHAPRGRAAHAVPGGGASSARLPKTAAGEVVRPILRRIAETGDPGDTSGLADPAVAAHLAKLRADALA